MLRPTLVVALGGTGTEVVMKLRERLLMEFGTPEPEGIRYLFVDTDIKNNRARDEFPSRFIGLSVGASRIVDCQQAGSSTFKNLRLDEWFDPDLRDRLTNQNFGEGVGGVRMYGRLALLAADSFDTLADTIQKDIQALHGQQQRLHVMVVASAGGGTGSGTFLDIGYLTRFKRQTLAIQMNACSVEGFIAVAVPTLVSTPAQKRNSAAVLTELDHFSSQSSVFRAVYGDTELPENIGKEAPYDKVFLVSPTQGSETLHPDDAKTAMGILEQRIADCLFVRLMGPADEHGVSGVPQTGEIDARIYDMSQNWQQFPEDNHGYPNRFLTMGVGLLHFPVGLCEQLGRLHAISHFVDRWLKPNQTDVLTTNELATDPGLKRLYDNDLVDIRRLLGLPGMQMQGSESLRDAEHDELYRELTYVEPGGMQPEAALLARCREGKQRVEDLFSYTEGVNQMVQPSAPGYVQGTVSNNIARLLDRHQESSLFNRVLNSLWDMAFDGSRGPRFVAALLEDLKKEVEWELGVIDEVLKSSGADAGNQSSETSAKRMRNDKLLLFWKEAAAERELVGGDADLATWANWRYEVSIVQAKQRVYKSILDELVLGGINMLARAKQLTNYIRQWRIDRQRGLAALEQMQNNLPPGTVWPRALIERKWKALTPDVDPKSLPQLRQTARGGEFVQRLPQGHGGQIDFSPFEPVEQTITASLKRIQDLSPGDSIYGESVIRLRSEERGGALAGDVDRIAADSRPLLNLDLAAPGYSELLNRFPQATYLWYSVVNPQIDAATYTTFTHEIGRARANLANTWFVGNGIAGSLNSDRGSIAAVISIRGAFPTRIINQYNPDSRHNLLYPPNVQHSSTAFTQSVVVEPVPEAEMENARLLLLMAEAVLRRSIDSMDVPKMVWEGADNHLFVYEVNEINGRIPCQLKLTSTDFESAARQLVTRRDAIECMNRAFNEIRKDSNQLGMVAGAIQSHIEQLTAKVNAGENKGYYDGLDLGGLDYRRARTRLLNGARILGVDLIGLTPSLHPWAAFDETDKLWRCQRCRKVLGSQAPGVDDCCTNPDCGYPNRLV